ncbi:TrmB family transcriptional regulator [Candidatus Woesearchaeota archaeon]|nr:TrmB family transcriptional regulator [Candidatus Woesearchaeota archaeon]
MNTDILTELGFSENDIKIYLTLLKSGSATAYELSKETGIYRAHVYDKLEHLMNKGLVTFVHIGSVRTFRATHPTKLNEFVMERKQKLEEQQNKLKKFLPELENIMAKQTGETVVEVFKGKEGLKFLLKDVIKTGKEVLISGVEESRYSEFSMIYMKRYFREIKTKKIRERVITSSRKEVYIFDKKLASTTEYKFIEETLLNPTNTFVYGNKIALVLWDMPITSILIHNPVVAATYRNQFERLWKIAKGRAGRTRR